MQFVILAIVTIPFKLFWQFIAFTLGFCLLKKSIGGYHSNSHGACLILSTLLVLTACITATLVAELPLNIMTIVIGFISALALLLVFLKAPVMHYNNPKTPTQNIRYRRQARKIIIVQVLILSVLAMACFKLDWLRTCTLSAGLGVMAAAITLLIPIPKQKGGI